MTATHGQRPPDLTHVAGLVYALVEFEQYFGPIPDHAVLRVFNTDDTELAVTVGGLGDEFLFGPDAHVPTLPVSEVSFRLTLAAIRLLRSIDYAITVFMPRVTAGTSAVPIQVIFETDAQTSDGQTFPEGVIVIRGGEIGR